MSHVFVVVATRDSEIETCETFSGLAALGRAFQLASDKSGRGRIDLFTASPEEEKLPDGSTRWVFMNTNKQSVVVFYRRIEEALLDSRDPNNLIGGLSNTKEVPKDVVPAGYGDHHHFDNLLLTYPPRGRPVRSLDDLWDAVADVSLPAGFGPYQEQEPVTAEEVALAETLLPDIEAYFANKINALEYVGNALPYGAGGNLAKALLDKDLPREKWDHLVIDVRSCQASMLISSFFNSFLQLLHDHDKDLCESARKATWLAQWEFQSENIKGWMENFKPQPPPFDFNDRSLPAGWDINGKPILMGALLDNPFAAKDPLRDLTEEQKWALVKARILKSPNYAVIPKGHSGFCPSRDSALQSVTYRDDMGKLIMEADIDILHAIREDMLKIGF